MKHRALTVFASAALAALLWATNGLADEPALRRSAAGDWTCRIGATAIGTMFVRARSYVLNRPGSAMAGEYEQSADRVIVTSGPLRGMGVEGGMLIEDRNMRTLAFPTPSGTTLSCHEVL
jgi:hypothetical protein